MKFYKLVYKDCAISSYANNGKVAYRYENFSFNDLDGNKLSMIILARFGQAFL